MLLGLSFCPSRRRLLGESELTVCLGRRHTVAVCIPSHACTESPWVYATYVVGTHDGQLGSPSWSFAKPSSYRDPSSLRRAPALINIRKPYVVLCDVFQVNVLHTCKFRPRRLNIPHTSSLVTSYHPRPMRDGKTLSNTWLLRSWYMEHNQDGMTLEVEPPRSPARLSWRGFIVKNAG